MNGECLWDFVIFAISLRRRRKETSAALPVSISCPRRCEQSWFHLDTVLTAESFEAFIAFCALIVDVFSDFRDVSVPLLSQLIWFG